MRINIGYFTSTGNSLWLGLKAKEAMEKDGHKVELYEIVKQGKELTAQECDTLGFIFPVWGSNPPDPLLNYMKNMTHSKGQKVFLVGNCAAFTGDTGLEIKKILKPKGYDVFYMDHILMPTNMNIPYLPENIWKVPTGEKLKNILTKAEKKLLKICEAILTGERKVEGRGPISRLGGFMQRKFYWMADWYKSRFLVSKAKCIKCGLCYRVCPVGNIQRTEDGEITFGNKCILCIKCYNLCPKNAILVCEKSIDDKKYRRYKGPGGEIKPVKYRK